ncbi:MAG: hypothetical protein ACE5OZ_19930 [Candidatus Heimdallarchaeota archaeon]
MTQQICTDKACLLAQAVESDPITLHEAYERKQILQDEFGGPNLALS